MTDLYKHFDKVAVYEPDYAHIRQWVVLPRKTVFINRAAAKDAKIIRVGWTRNDNVLRLPFED